MKTRNEIAKELYNINRQISLYWIGLQQMPTQETIGELNKKLGQIIKDLRVDE